MNILCPTCQRPLTVQEQFAGWTMKCPLCSNPFTVPEVPPGGIPEASPPEAAPADSTAPSEGSSPSGAIELSIVPQIEAAYRDWVERMRRAQAEEEARPRMGDARVIDVEWEPSGQNLLDFRPAQTEEAQAEEAQAPNRYEQLFPGDRERADRYQQRAEKAAAAEMARIEREVARAGAKAQKEAERLQKQQDREEARAEKQAAREQSRAEKQAQRLQQAQDRVEAAAAREVERLKRQVEREGERAAQQAQRAQQEADRQQAQAIDRQQKSDRALSGRYEGAYARHVQGVARLDRLADEREARNAARRGAAQRRVAGRLGLGGIYQAIDFGRDVGEAFGLGNERSSDAEQQQVEELRAIRNVLEELLREMVNDGASLSERNRGEPAHEASPSAPATGDQPYRGRPTVVQRQSGPTMLERAVDALAGRGGPMRPSQINGQPGAPAGGGAGGLIGPLVRAVFGGGS